MEPLKPNATLIERIVYYSEIEADVQARTLCTVADYLEDCWAWDVCFDDE